jgi:DNA polymerase-3 subunit delta
LAQLEPAYLVLGNDRPKVATVLARLKKHFDDGAVEQHSALTTSAADVVADSMMLGLLAARRLIIVTGADAWKAPDVSAVLGYLKSPSEDTVLLLTAEKLASNSRLKKAFSGPMLIECNGPSGEAQLTKWAVARFKAHGASVPSAVAGQLVRTVGEDSLDRLETEIARIAVYANGEPVDAAMVEQLAISFAEEKVWALTDAWATRNRAALLAVAEQLGSSQGEHPARLVGVIGRHLRQVHAARSLLQGGAPSGMVAQELANQGVNQWVAKRLVEQAGRIGMAQADAALARVAMLEAELKGGSNLTGHIAGGRDAQTVIFHRGLCELI